MANLNKINAREVSAARIHLNAHDNYAAYAEGIAAAHRAATKSQQDAIWDEVCRDAMQHFFRKENGALVARFDAIDPELVLVELAA